MNRKIMRVLMSKSMRRDFFIICKASGIKPSKRLAKCIIDDIENWKRNNFQI